jgi:DNA (cytosine-5)-methyltransferase 1
MTEALIGSQAANRVRELAKLYGSSEVATRLGASTRTVERWSSGQVKMPSYLDPAIDRNFGMKGKLDSIASNATFVDLFAGIGGIRLGLESAGATCVFTSEWDRFAVKTYSANHQSRHQIVGDINGVKASELPDHSILAAGFPCQPFSLAGVSKKNSLGRSHGFLDPAQGTLFFNVAEIIAEKQPAAFLLENVKNLKSHDGGRTFRIILEILEKELGYTIQHKVIDAKGFVPQHRERIIIAGFRDGQTFDWDDVKPISRKLTLDEILHREDGSEASHSPYVEANGLVNDKYTLSDGLWGYLQAYAAKHKAAGNGFGFGLVGRGDTSRTLSARYYKDGSEILVSQGAGNNPRRLTPRECARLMGFEDTFEIPVSDTQAYKQFGNSVAVPVIAAVAKQIVLALDRSA